MDCEFSDFGEINSLLTSWSVGSKSKNVDDKNYLSHLNYIFSISSKLFPFVSGSFFSIKIKPAKLIIAYNQNVPLALSILLSIGKV